MGKEWLALRPDLQISGLGVTMLLGRLLVFYDLVYPDVA